MKQRRPFWIGATILVASSVALACGSSANPSQGSEAPGGSSARANGASGSSGSSSSGSGSTGSGTSGDSSGLSGSAAGSAGSTGSISGSGSGAASAGAMSGSGTSGQASGAPSSEGGAPAEGGTASDGGSPSTTAMGPIGPAPTAASAAKQGPYKVQTYTSGVPSAQDYVNPTVYYTTDVPGPYPGVVVIPGFTETQSALNQWGTFLASYGFVVMMVDTAASGAANTGVAPAGRANGLMEGVATLKAENTRSGSPLNGKLDTSRMVIMGHSMGGGGTLIAANMHSSELKAAVGLNPWNPGGTYPNDTVPTLVYDGTADTLVPPSAGKPEYDSIPTTTPKAYVEFNGGSHFVALTPLGTASTDPVVARIGLSWLEVYVIGDQRYAQFIAKDPTMSTFDKKP